MTDNKSNADNSSNDMKSNILNDNDIKVNPFQSNASASMSDLEQNTESNCQLPRIVSDNSDLNNNYDTFITDKIKYIYHRPIPGYDQIDQDSCDINPYILNQLCMDVKEKQQYPPKGLNPLFFVINPEKPINKDHYRTLPRSFKPSHLPYNFNDNYMKYITNQLEKIEDQKMLSSHHGSLNKKTFVQSFNKNMNNRLTFKTDLKKIIFNNGKDLYEDKVKMIRQLTKMEMINRASGKGMFMMQNSNREKKKRKCDLIAEQRKSDIKDNPLKIDLEKKECFDNRKFLNKTGEVFFNRNFLRLTFDSYKQQKNDIEIERKQTIKYNFNVQRLYAHGKKSYDYVTVRDNKMKEAIKNYSKIGSKSYSELHENLKSFDNKPNNNYNNQSYMSDNDHILIHE